MSLYEFCKTMMDNFGMGNHPLRILSQASNEYAFVGTFGEFMLRRDFTISFVSSRVLGVSMFLAIEEGQGEYATMISI